MLSLLASISMLSSMRRRSSMQISSLALLLLAVYETGLAGASLDYQAMYSPTTM